MATVTRYVNTASTAGGDGTTNGTSGSTRAYASLSEAEAALQRSTSDIIEILCSGTAADTTALTVSGWTVSSPGLVYIKGNNTDKKWNTSAYRLEVNGYPVTIAEENVLLENIQAGINTNTTSGRAAITFSTAVAAGRSEIKGCIVRAMQSTTGLRIGLDLRTNNATFKVWNNIIYDCIGSSTSCGIRQDSETPTMYVYHNTFCNCEIGFRTADPCAQTRLANNLFQDNTHSVQNGGGGSFHSASDYNVCDDNETSTYLVPGSNSVKSTEITFTDEANDDFSTSDTDCQVANNLYGDSTLPITTDIIGSARPSSGSVYAGAYESTTTSQTVTPSTLTGTGTLNAPTVIISPTVSPSVLTATGTLNAPTVLPSIIVPDDYWDPKLNATLNVPSYSIGTTVSPAVLTATGMLNAPTISAGTSVSMLASTLEGTGTLESPTVTATQFVTVTPSAQTATGTLSAPTIGISLFVEPATLTATGTLNAPTITTTLSETIIPGTLTAAVNLNTPTVLAVTSLTVTPSTLAATGTLGTATVTSVYDASVTPASLSLTGTLSAPTATEVSTIILITPATFAVRAMLSPVLPFAPKPIRFIPNLNKDLSNLPHRLSQLSDIVDEVERRLRKLED